MQRDPELKTLRALIAVSAESSMSAAGHRLGVSQQAVSLRIRGLERDLGVRRLARSARGSRLTPSGELVVGWASTLIAAADDFADAVGALRSDQRSTLPVAASLTIAEHVLPEWIARWRSSHAEPIPIVQLIAANISAVVQAVRTGEADLGFIEAPAAPSDLGSAVVAHDTIEIVVPDGHRWAKRGSVGVQELAATPLVLREPGSGTRQALEEALNTAGAPLSVEPAAVLSTTLDMRSAILAGAGPGALSSLAVAADVRAGRLVAVPVEGLSIVRPFTAIWASPAPSTIVREFLSVGFSSSEGASSLRASGRVGRR